MDTILPSPKAAAADQTTMQQFSLSLGGAHTPLEWSFPEALRAQRGYDLTIMGELGATGGLRLRNPLSGAELMLEAGALAQSFVVPEAGFSQLIFDGGAQIAGVHLQEIGAEEVMASAPPRADGVSAGDLVAMMGRYDDTRFIDSYAADRISKNPGNAKALMMFLSHGYEKGLARNAGFRPGFGAGSMAPLAREMAAWIAGGGDANEPFFQIACSIMQAYFKRHAELGVDVSHSWALFTPDLQQRIEAADPSLGGALAVSQRREPAFPPSAERSFVDVVEARRSVREFIQAPVDDHLIEGAIAVALQAPSVCNRQTVRVHQIDDPALMAQVLALQGGYVGYGTPPKLLLVTSDLTAFIEGVERNQAFVDGGLFLMLLMLGLQNYGLGTCPLNTAFDPVTDRAVRDLLGIGPEQVLISFVAVGHHDPDTLVPRSKRLSPQDIWRRLSA